MKMVTQNCENVPRLYICGTEIWKSLNKNVGLQFSQNFSASLNLADQLHYCTLMSTQDLVTPPLSTCHPVLPPPTNPREVK